MSQNPDAAAHHLPTSDPPTKAELLEQYALVSQSLDYLVVALTAILLNYHAVDLQKQQLAAAVEGRSDPFPALDLFPLQMTAAVMLLGVSSFFFDVSQQALQTPAATPALAQNQQLNGLINTQVLTAAAARVYGLLLVHGEAEAATSPSDMTETIVEDSSPL